MTEVDAAKEKRLARCRVNQKRYRVNKKKSFALLEKDVPELAKQVARLEGQLDVLRAAVRLSQPEFHVASEYFRLFRYSQSRNAQQQFEFLTATMDPEINFMGQIGIDKLLAQWGLYHCLFHSFEMTCQSMQTMTMDHKRVVRAPATMDLRISRTTIEALYPHVLCNERLVQKLIGQVLRMNVLIHLHYDEDGRVVIFDTAADMTVGWANLLESLDDTLAILDGARIKYNAELDVDEALVPVN
ncbi:hypothetical protein ACHHYP_09152 [Achlya hypogyna]|uniref:Bzip transcription factor n=1 Tax=Achlya hypogyna TaxID=1202772 RepID=A0A1V9ZJH3_ACHHY|nr:hypothetical protein ACHHYP_09152 [Achlya hypogyna]